MSSSSLFIGIGGNGLKILSKLKIELEKEGISNPKDVAFLGIDIGGQDFPSNLNQNEIINIDEGDVGSIIKSDYYWTYLKSWWFDRNYIPDFKFRQGAWQLRILGRLALFYKGSEIIRRLTNIFNVLQGNGIEIFVISSASGGTGAGFFRDMPAVIKQTPNLPSQHNIFGFLLNYDIVKQFNTKDHNSSIRSENNAVALFSELDTITLKQPNYEFYIINPNNVDRPYQLNLKERYRWIFIETLNNELGARLDYLEDYYELASMILKNAYFMSNNLNNDKKSWSGIENSIGSMINIITQPIKTNLMLKNGNLIDYEIPVKLVNHYLGFGGFILEFSEDEIREYLITKTLNEVVEELKNSELLPEELNKVKKLLLNDIQESQNQDKLLFIVQNLMAEIAKELRKPLFSGNKINLIQNLKEEFINSQDLSSLINSLKSDAESILSTVSNRLGFKFDQLIDRIITDVKEKFINNFNLNLKQKLFLLEELIKTLKYEIDDYTKSEVDWASKNDKKVASEILDNEIKKYGEYLSNIGIFEKLFKKSEIESTKNTYLESIANVFINTFLRSLILQISNPFILNLFDQIIKSFLIEKQNIELQLKEIENFLSKKTFYFPDDLQSIIHCPTEADFHIKIAKVKSIIDNYIFKPNLNNLLFSIKVDDKIIFNNFNELKNKIENNVRNVLQNYTLDNGLELEARYFINDLPIILSSSSNGKIAKFNNLKEFAQNSSEEEKKIFYGTYNEYFDTNSLIAVIDKLKNQTDEKIIESCIEDLIIGRLDLVFNRWNSSFIKLVDISGINKPSRYIAYKINNEKNKKTFEYFHKKITENVTFIQNKSNTKLEFVNFCVGFSLAQLDQFFTGLRSKELNRIKTNISYFRDRRFTNPDSSNIFHNDKRFLENIQLLNYTPLIVPIEIDKVINCWKIILLLLILDYIDTKNMKLKKSLLDHNNLKMLENDLVFLDYDELFRLVYLQNNTDLELLIKKLEKEISSINKKEGIFENVETYFRDNRICDSLLPILVDYLDDLKKNNINN